MEGSPKKKEIKKTETTEKQRSKKHKKHARKSDAEKYGKMMKNDAKKGAKSQQKPSKIEV